MAYCLLANLLTRWYGDRMGVQDRIKVYKIIQTQTFIP